MAIAILLLGGFFAASVVSPVYASTPTVSPLNLVGITANTTSIDWGTLSPNSSETRAVNITNAGSSNITLLLSSSSWAPSGIDRNLSLTWDYSNETIFSLQSLIVNLTLTVSASASPTAFSFNIIISTVLPGTPFGVYVVPVVFAAFGITGVVVAWRYRRTQKTRQESVP
ncbi:MAG: hypothetical protein ABSB71_13405 [Candidatus Bathyarchaeia archaeon]